MKRSLLKPTITSATTTTTATTLADKSDGSDIIKINKKIQNATEDDQCR